MASSSSKGKAPSRFAPPLLSCCFDPDHSPERADGSVGSSCMPELRAAADSIVEAFRKHDHRGSKVIDRVAFASIIRELQPSLSEAELESLLGEAGIAPKEPVNYEQFITWLCSDKDDAAPVAEPAAPATAEAEPQAAAYVQEFFPHLFGFEEKGGYEAVQGRFAVEEDKQGITLVSKANGRRFYAGAFSCPSLASLREEEKRLAGSSSGGGAARKRPLEVRHVVTNSSLEDHAAPSNAGALFQVASQFNCLEFTSNKRIPEEGVSGYVHDCTQGPDCAVACAPATVYRNYLVPVTGADKAAPELGQTAERQLNLLEDLEVLLGNRDELAEDGHGRYFWLQNGYVCSDAKRLQALGKRLEELGETGRDELRASVKVGLGLGSEVVFSALVPFEGLVPVPAGSRPRASQVFSAAANVMVLGSDPDDWEPFARLLLEATYEAALWAGVRNARLATEVMGQDAAALAGSRRVMLTSVGGGVFGNRSEWITDAMNRALQALAKEAPDDGWGLEVCVAHFQHINASLEKAVQLAS